MKYYAKLDATNHISNIYLTAQLVDATDYTLVNVPDGWLDLFIRDWTNFYIKEDGSLDFDNNKATKTQQQISNLQNTVDQLLANSIKEAE